MVIALAGRRIDAPDAAEVRFPSESLARVAEEIRIALERLGAGTLVCSAACGSDILALEAAKELGMRSRIVLPFARAQFRESSVADRPGDWGQRFDALLDEVERHDDLVILGFEKGGPKAYPGTNHGIFAEADLLARDSGEEVRAIAVWDGRSRGEGDVTARFVSEAKESGYAVTEILTVI